MLSNEGSRQSDRIREGQTAPALKESVIKESVEGQKKSLIIDVMEARLSRLQNYKLARDTKFLDEKVYTLRAKEIQEFLKKIATTNDPKAIEAASFHLSLDDGQLIRDQLLPQWSKGVIDIQKVALTLMRADNGTEQVEKIAANTLGDLFSQGVTKLNTDAKAKSDIVRRANKHFGEMMSQGALDNATPEQQNAARAGLEAMYQMRYIAKEYIGETGGIAVPAGLQVVWGNYRDSMDIKNEWFNWSDTGKTQIASFLLYDLAPMIISGGVAGAVGKGAISIASRMPAIVNYANSGTKIAKVVSVGARAGLAVTEAAVFDATFEGIRNQRWFMDKPHWQQDLLKNSLGFGFSRYLAGATKFAGIPLDPLSNHLVKQGLIVPAIITGVGVGQKLMANDPDAYDGAWEEFLLGAIMTGAFHMTGKILESKYPAKETGIQKLEMSPDGKKVDITTRDGQKFTTKMTDQLKSRWPKDTATKPNPRKTAPDITDVEAKVPKTNAPAQKTADAPTTQRSNTSKISIEDIRGSVQKYPEVGQTYQRAEVASFKTSKGSEYTFLADGTTQRNKVVNTLDKGLHTPQDLLVFIKAPKAITEEMASGLHAMKEQGGIIKNVHVVDLRSGAPITTNKQAMAAEGHMAIGLFLEPGSAIPGEPGRFATQRMPLTSHTDGKTLLYEVTTQPTIGTSTFDMRANSKHIGNQVTEVTLKSVVSNSPSKAESTIQVQKDAPLQLEWNGKKTPKIETTPVASTEFGQAFVNSHTLNYKIDLLPDGKHIVRVKGVGETEWKIATEEHGIPRGDGYARKNYEERIAHEVGLLKKHPNYKESTLDKTGDTPKTPIEGEKVTVKANDVTGKQGTADSFGIKDFIENKHGIGRKGLTEADLLGGSFRSEMDAMMKMDDAAFRSLTDRPSGRMYEKEMHEAAAKVRKMSDAEVQAAAIKGPNGTPILNRSGRNPGDMTQTISKLKKSLETDRVSLQSMKNNGVDHADMQAKVTAGENLLNKLESELLSTKASIVAENAALRSRLSDIINKKAPGLADAIIAKEPSKVVELLKRYWWVIPAIALALFGLSKCNGGKGTGDSSTPEALAADLCGTDSGKAKGDIIDGRKSDAGATLTEKRRESISQKWMQTPKWKALVVEFRKNEELLKGSRFADAFNAMLRNPTVSGVQHIQRWVGMEGVDNKQNQDGILGAITTDAISKFIEKCQTTKSVPSLVDQIPK